MNDMKKMGTALKELAQRNNQENFEKALFVDHMEAEIKKHRKGTEANQTKDEPRRALLRATFFKAISEGDNVTVARIVANDAIVSAGYEGYGERHLQRLLKT